MELIDLRSLKPFDDDLIINSVKKTGKLLVVDVGWTSFGASAEIAAVVAEKVFYDLKSPIKRLALKNVPAPASRELEKGYFINKDMIKEAIVGLYNGKSQLLSLKK